MLLLASQRAATTTMSSQERQLPEKQMLSYNNNYMMKLLNCSEVHYWKVMTQMLEINLRKQKSRRKNMRRRHILIQLRQRNTDLLEMLYLKKVISLVLLKNTQKDLEEIQTARVFIQTDALPISNSSRVTMVSRMLINVSNSILHLLRAGLEREHATTL